MKKFLVEHKEGLFVWVYSFLISFIVLMFTSKNSFLYPFNDWVDANAFFTVGKSMVRGIVPYLDLFEQKGPFLYLIYGIASLISFKSFIGVFSLEVLSFTIALYFLYKCLKIFLSIKSSLLVMLLYTVFITTTFSFTHGGSAEEFMMPMFMASLYYFFKHFKGQKLSKKEMFINGVIALLVLMTKYTLLGFWIGLALAIFIDYILDKEYKKAILYPIILLGGMVLTFGIFAIYFILNGALEAFIDNYFIVNITSYGEKLGLFEKLKTMVIGIGGLFKKNTIIMILMMVGLGLMPLLKENKRWKITYLMMVVITIFFVFFGLKFYRYYLLFVLFNLGVALLIIFMMIDKYIRKLSKYKYAITFCGMILLSIIYVNYFANYKEFRDVKKEDLFQYKFADIINKEKDASLVNMGHLDAGVFTTTGLLPSTYYFENQNISYEDYPDIIDSFQDYIRKKKTMFIVYFSKLDLDRLKTKEEQLFINYDLIEHEKQYFEGILFHAYLFKVKEG